MAATQPEAGTNRLRGLPLRFVFAILGLWTSARVIMTTSLLPGAIEADAHPTPSAMNATLSPRITAAVHLDSYYGRIIDIAPPSPSRRLDHIPIVRAGPSEARLARFGQAEALAVTPSPLHPALAMLAVPSPATAAKKSGQGALASVTPVISLGRWPRQAQWSGSAWLFWRGNEGQVVPGTTGQLGGAQAGFRVNRLIGRLNKERVPVSAYARLSGALHDPVMPEAALGVALAPLSGRVSVSFGLERRIALGKDARNAFALVMASGLNLTRIAGPLIAEGYAQAGMVGFSRTDPFADGRLSFTVPLDRNERTRLGVSVSGGAQPDLSRLDIGPAIETRLPLGGVDRRLALEWRHRVAGNSRPDSGIAVTLASDF